MPVHPPNNVCRFWQTLLGVVVTNLLGADLNSSAGPKGGGQDARNKAMQGNAFRRLATKAGEKCGLLASGWQPGVKSRLFHRAIKSHRSSYE